MALLCLGALGVVFGDIGTSPIYALREAFHGDHATVPTPENILGVLSLILWALIIVISIKYLLFVMRADNGGEGGIIALVALINPSPPSRRGYYVLILMGLFGAALLYGDGTITPAISVLSAVEGLKVATPALEPYVVPITIALLIGLFIVQKRGTTDVGRVFGPVILVWFIALGVLGLSMIVREPSVLVAVNPYYGAEFLVHSGASGYLVLGTVFLVVTGGEALHADMGHFGLRPIRLSWFFVVLPGLMLNYFGQGALLLSKPEASQPFYQIAPAWGLYPLVILATLATIIASQAVITGVFSLTRQAIQLGQLPRMKIMQTSREAYGQIYIPVMNWLLMVATIALVLGFRSSGNMAAAYGVAVSTDMVITTILAFFVARHWGWNPILLGALAAVLLVVDLSFFGANLLKVPDGGWYALAVGAFVFFVMMTWRKGRELLMAHLRKDTELLMLFLTRIASNPPVRVPGTGVFLTEAGETTPPILLHHLKHNKVLHEQVVFLTVRTERVPWVKAAQRLEVKRLGQGVYRVIVRVGFKQNCNLPLALRMCDRLEDLHVDLDTTTFYVGVELPIPSPKVPGMRLWRERLFAFMSRNAARRTDMYAIPSERVVVLGIQVDL
ncbi:MAG TPA: KUP/HAK/KT family potassium transporter [Gammaproteobacteria bacterium]|nr:KUP/HAK/KT family potassium transporter [Gammaproteobacteria bacterium]